MLRGQAQGRVEDQHGGPGWLGEFSTEWPGQAERDQCLLKAWVVAG